MLEVGHNLIKKKVNFQYLSIFSGVGGLAGVYILPKTPPPRGGGSRKTKKGKTGQQQEGEEKNYKKW